MCCVALIVGEGPHKRLQRSAEQCAALRVEQPIDHAHPIEDGADVKAPPLIVTAGLIQRAIRIHTVPQVLRKQAQTVGIEASCGFQENVACLGDRLLTDLCHRLRQDGRVAESNGTGVEKFLGPR